MAPWGDGAGGSQGPRFRRGVDYKSPEHLLRSERSVPPVLCDLCGKPMPEGEESFRYHGFSGPCPK